MQAVMTAVSFLGELDELVQELSTFLRGKQLEFELLL